MTAQMARSDAHSGVRQAEIACSTLAGRELRLLRWKRDSDALARPLLFFSGIGSNAEILAPFLSRLSGRDVITFDMPGIGGSSAAGGPYRFETIAKASVAVIDSLGYEKIDVMGVSWGGLAAQQLAHSHPQRVGRLVLAGTTAGIAMVPGRLSALAMMLNYRRFKDPAFLRRHFGQLYGGSNAGWDWYCASVREPTALGYLYQLGALAGWTSLGFLSDMRARTLILGGSDDALVRRSNLRLLHRLIPQSELRLIDGAGHMLLLSHLEEAASIVEQFLDENVEIPGTQSAYCV